MINPFLLKKARFGTINMTEVKKLFDFAGEPTRVVAEVSKVHTPEEIEKTSQMYLASEQGFNNYCRDCTRLLMIQETGINSFPIRVFCKVEKCVK